ncbi:MAG: hypothetical protein K0M70_04510 [Arenimonas sp.]|uniref:hypothetical protein n=1 Tax=Arenimonas sp. TaxID=1872635 RepID=UPI0025C461FC|nr:hypothetical protein [Arenimonas sp.]MBW8367104.1 hypothetical protein [Arenimonas sp.]
MDTHQENPPGRRATAAGRSAAAALLAVSVLWLWSALAAIANHAFRYPAFDQYRFYPKYLDLDFPASALQLENGHRPIVPALVHIAEIHLTAADQGLQILLGVGLALLTAAGIALPAWRQRRSALAGAAAVLMTVLAIFWLANARMLMHGSELLNVYLVSAATVLALACVQAASQARPVAWMALAGLLATAATFSFGAGMACFPALLLLAALRRLPARAFVLPALMFALVAVVYLAQLPGNDGVRSSISIQPLANLRLLLQWLASPWFHAWLGFAEPGFFSWNPGGTAIERMLGGSAQGVANVLGGGWIAFAGVAIGSAGLAAYGAMVLGALRRPLAITRRRSMGIGLSTFALAVGALVCVARLPAFEAVPLQVMADRYLPWVCLFWLGLGLGFGGAPLPRSGGWRPWVTPVGVLLLLACLWPSHVGWAGWSAAVHRIVQQSAVAAQLGIWDPHRFPRTEDAGRAEVERSLVLMRERRVAMFAEPAYGLVADNWRAPRGDAFVPAVAHAAVVRRFHDEHGQREVAAIEGWVSRIEHRPRHPVLVVVDAQGAIRGLAKFSFIGPAKAALRLNVPAKRGFDGYVVDPRPGEALRVLVLDPHTRQVLAQVPFAPGG